MQVLSSAVAEYTHCRIKLDVQTQGQGWRNVGSIDTADHSSELDNNWRSDLRTGAERLQQDTYVKQNDPHYDV